MVVLARSAGLHTELRTLHTKPCTPNAMTRRHFIESTASAASGATVLSSLSGFSLSDVASRPADFPIGMCDWNLGASCDPGLIPRASEVGLKGIQVSVGTRPDFVPLRSNAVRRHYLELGKEHGIAFPSVAAGSILNQIPLKSEPQSAIYVVDAIEAAKALGSTNVLMAFFGNGDLRLRDSTGEFRNVSEGPFSSYELDARGVTRVVEALRQIVPRAEEAGIVLGLENTLTAVQNLDIIDRVGSDWVQVYYDTGNSTAYGYDPPSEIRMLGNDRICEIHIKETLGLDDPNRPLLGGPDRQGVDFEGVAEACKAIGFDKWYILETSGREGAFEEDTRANVAFAKRLFG